MAVITSAVLGVGTAVYGAVQQNKATKKANQQNAVVAANQKQVQQASQRASEASIRAERLRERQMELEGIRRRRDILRSAQVAGSMGLAAAIGQGVDPGSSSVRAGQQAARSRQTGDLLANYQNIEIGRGVFRENRRITEANAQGAQFQTSANIASSAAQSSLNQASQYQSLVGFGLNLANSGPQIDRVAQTTANLFNPLPWSTTTYDSQGRRL